ncbi:MAG: hypothetical protein IT379_29005, partial [Deltaproteobacteria bacterium]|nr:hypothetical protein [Deltaproteobacteria bacterium]
MQRGWLAAATVSWLVAACDEAQTVQCGPGGAAVRGGDGRAYCVYRGAPDRTCPEAYPFPVDVGATRVCAEVRTTIG